MSPRIMLILPPPFDMENSWRSICRPALLVNESYGTSPLPAKGPGSSYRVRRLAPQNLDSELNELVKEIIQPWLNGCLKDHPECRTTSGDETSNYPKRLIFVGNSNGDTLKLVEIGTQRPPYLILSYCWGSTNASARTTYRNLQARLDRMDLSKLPRTVQDAIKLTRNMGKEYIWIDALCIEQAEDDQPGDWDNEASKVGDYYANAECLISAMRASESAQGFLTERASWRYPQRRALLVYGETWCHREEISFWADGPDQTFWYEKESEPLHKRGWCLQERILCPRRLHWTKNGLFWECNTAEKSEQEPFSGNFPFEYISPLLEVYPRPVTILRKDKSEALLKDWCLLTKDYSHMKLSYEKDRFAAIHGIATRLAKRHNDTYYAGVFGSQLASGLLHVDEHASREIPGSSDSPICFPTWSWAAAWRGVEWPWSTYNPGRVSLVELVGFPPVPQSSVQTDFTQLDSRKLRIKAPLVRIFPNGNFVKDNVGWVYVSLKIRICKTAELEEDLDLGLYSKISIKFDPRSITEPKEGMPIPDLFAVILLYDNWYYGLYGIILHKGYMDNKELYTREGVLYIDGIPTSAVESGLWRSELTLV
ncbi:hypothetical protein F53441_10601 [Fusarium austroafricanum]|uniref:Heterokaryon incompatibility domain-containing protein n=1 Tax=Fusarium austroafricanum TaxID=2364996 RepID=A0A8H4NS49_9HYPO|nr:hypothetical protein F53441_10601 [Fusarium austroafricanum]